MQADILVLDHDPAGRQFFRDIEILGLVFGGDQQTLAQLVFGPVLDEVDTGGRADVHTGVAFNAESEIENGLYIAIQAAFCLRLAVF